jgi:predicted phage gp36 major capsid-like protein
MLEIIIGIIALAMLIGVVVLARLVVRIGRAADEVGLAARRVAELAPAARGLIESTQSELQALRSLTGTATQVVDDVRSVTGQASTITSQIMRGFESEVARRYRAIFAGARAGFDVLRQFRSSNGSLAFRSVQEEEEFNNI